MKRFLIPFLLYILVSVASAQISVDYRIGLEKILPGDIVDCELVIRNSNLHSEELRSVVFYSDLVKPRLVTDIGTLAPSSEYILPFTFQADKPGKYTVQVKVRTYNGSVSYYIPFSVVEDYPKVFLENSRVVVGEDNLLRLNVEWYENVTVRPLFNASPSESHGKEFEFLYKPENKENLTFEIEFLNGNNRHIITKTYSVEWQDSRDVVLNISSKSTAYRNESVKITAGITNLRNSPVYDIALKIGDRVRKIPVLDAGESRIVEEYLTAGERIEIFLEYTDESGIKHAKQEEVEMKILDKDAVSLCGYSYEEGTIAGEICNFGDTEIRNVMVEFKDKSYFVGSILPKDYEVFSLEGEGNGSIKVSWEALSGEVFTRSFTVFEEKPALKSTGNEGREILYISTVLAVVIVLIAVYAMRRR